MRCTWGQYTSATPRAPDHRLIAAYCASLPQTRSGCSRGSVWAHRAPPIVHSTIHSQLLIIQIPSLFFPILLPLTSYFPSPPYKCTFTDLPLAITTNKTATNTSSSTITQRKQNNSNRNNDNNERSAESADAYAWSLGFINECKAV